VARRTYDQHCALAHGLDVLGERWTLLVIRELLLGPQRFSDLEGSLIGIGPNMLAARLRQMENDGLIEKRRLPPPASSTVYTLTGRGAALEPVIIELGRWGRHRLPPTIGHEAFRPGWLLIALKVSFDPDHAADLDAVYQLTVAEEPFIVRISGGSIDVVRGAIPDADVTIDTDQDTLLALANGTLSPGEAIKTGALRVAGDDTAARAWFQAFTVVHPAAR
jgi:DNA-binding HxlR family transcriptional regulator/putative sterol carrier protein